MAPPLAQHDSNGNRICLSLPMHAGQVTPMLNADHTDQITRQITDQFHQLEFNRSASSVPGTIFHGVGDLQELKDLHMFHQWRSTGSGHVAMPRCHACARACKHIVFLSGTTSDLYTFACDCLKNVCWP